MPEQIFLPDCLMDCYQYMFPNTDWSCVTFYRGLPAAAIGNHYGFTMATGLSGSPDIHVYLRDYDPCDYVTFVQIAHELVHVHQIQHMNGNGGFPGSWATYYTSHWICAGFKSDCSNDLEREAYEFADGCGNWDGKVAVCVKASPIGNQAPCECAPAFWPRPRSVRNPKGGPPETYLEALTDCGNVVFYASSVGHTLCSVIAGIFGLIAGAISLFAYRNIGGAIGATVGAVAGAVAGFVIGLILSGPWGAGFGAYIGAIVGAIVGGAIGFAINWFASRNTGGAIGAGVGAVAGAVAGAIIGGVFFGPLGAVVGGFLGAAIGAVVGGAVGFAVNWAIDWIAGWDTGAASRIWFTVFDDASNYWMIPDAPVTHGGNSLTSRRPALAMLNPQKLFCVYRSSGDDSLWYNVFDGTKWMDDDVKITNHDHTKTYEAPALAAYDGKLYLAYKSSGDENLWYNVYENGAWRDVDSQIPSSQSSSGPALAEYNGLLYLAYKGKASHNTIWYNVFDKQTQSWWPEDRSISQGGNTLTQAEPALAAYTDPAGNRKLYVAYRGKDDTYMWYNVFDGATWQYQDLQVASSQSTRGPSLVEYHGKLYMFYRSRWNDDLWYNVFDGNTWDSDDHDISRDDHVLSKYGPASAKFLNIIFLVYRDNS